MGVHYMDLITECEKLGDYVVNVVEAHCDVKEKESLIRQPDRAGTVFRKNTAGGRQRRCRPPVLFL